jgi:starvation-inducible outer membrane lipoprotein
MHANLADIGLQLTHALLMAVCVHAPDTLKEHNDWYVRAFKNLGVKNFTAPADRLQSFFLAFRKDQPPTRAGSGDIVAADSNLFTRDFKGLIDPSVNGRPGDVETGRFTYYEDVRVPRYVCMHAFVYKNWTAEGMVEGLPNDWFVPARRNPKMYPPPAAAKWGS